MYRPTHIELKHDAFSVKIWSIHAKHCYTRVTLKLLTPPFPNKNERFIRQPRIQLILKSSQWRLNSSLDRFHQDRKKGKKSTFKRNLNVTLTASSTSFESKLPFLACFLSILRTRGNSRWIDDQVRVGEELVESRWCIEKIVEDKSGMALNRRRSKWLIFRPFLPVPYAARPLKLSYYNQKGG